MSQRFQPPTPEELNPYFPAFHVTDFIAQGGMGAVFKATQISLERPVAIKILPYELGLDIEFSSSFEAEAKAMAKLSHPNLVQVYDFGNIDGMLYIIMEFVPGRSLYDSAHKKSVNMSEAARLISAMCRGLDHAHKSGLIHRDIKPGNVLIDAHARPKIVDFGLARGLDETRVAETIYGTRGYTAPEVLRTPDKIDQRVDIFSMGAMLYELLTGRLPPHPYIPASTISDSDSEFDTIILKALHPQRELRYPCAAEMADELDYLAQRLEKVHTALVQLKRPEYTQLGDQQKKLPNNYSRATLISICLFILLTLSIIFLTTQDEDQHTGDQIRKHSQPTEEPHVTESYPLESNKGETSSL